MLSVLLGVHFVLTLAIIGLILLQKHDSDGALGSSGGGAASGMFTVRGQANILTRSTAILMTIFMVNCLVMAKITKNTPTKESVIDRVARESVIPQKDSATEESPEKAMTTPEKNDSKAETNQSEKTDGQGVVKTEKNTKPTGKKDVPAKSK